MLPKSRVKCLSKCLQGTGGRSEGVLELRGRRKKAAHQVAMKNLNLAVLTLLIIIVSQCSSSSEEHQFQTGEVSQVQGRPTRQQVSFAEPETDNVQRVAVGRPVKFKCVVNNIGDHKVSVLESFAQVES